MSMASSVTRSNRRAEGPRPQHHNVNVDASGPLTRLGPGPSLFHPGSGAASVAGGRMKRPLEIPDRDVESVKNRNKKSRIAIEFLANPPTLSSSSSPSSSIEGLDAQKTKTPAVPRQPAGANREDRLAVSGQPTTITTTTTTKPTVSATPKQDNGSGKNQTGVKIGVKHEVDKLQSRKNDTREQGRKLRSQEATRFKSELSAYFPDYDEVIGNDPKEEHLLNPDTPMVIVDSKFWRVFPDYYRAANQPHHADSIVFPVRGYGDALFTDVFDSQRIDFSFLEAQHKTNSSLEDPLPDSLFEPIHRRAERLERSIRNTEKGRAQHEKDQIVRLLDSLQGHDWLRVMGVSGVTETKKKAFEPARLHFIKGCQSILSKFRNWSVEEKRRKHEKERALAERADKEGGVSHRAKRHGTDESASRVIEDSDEDDEDDDDEEEEEEEEEEDDDDDDEDGAVEDFGTSHDDTSEASSPAKQLYREARARSKMTAVGSRKSRSGRQPDRPRKPPEAPKEFKSFFRKKYERDGALHRHRRAGRNVLAWGHSIPDIPECDFVLPEEYRDEDTLRARARKKRRDRRESRQP